MFTSSQVSRLVELFWFNNSTTKTTGIIMRQFHHLHLTKSPWKWWPRLSTLVGYWSCIKTSKTSSWKEFNSRKNSDSKHHFSIFRVSRKFHRFYANWFYYHLGPIDWFNLCHQNCGFLKPKNPLFYDLPEASGGHSLSSSNTCRWRVRWMQRFGEMFFPAGLFEWIRNN